MSEATPIGRLTAEVDENALELLELCDEVECTVRRTPGFSLFAGVHVGKAWYRDLGAHCACADLSLYRFADCAYSLCTEHGFQAIGTLAREVVR